MIRLSKSNRASLLLPRLVLALLLGWVTGSLAGPAAGPAAEFDLANKLYEQGKYAEAAGKYEQLLRDHVVSPAVYFNLGNAFFKSDRIGRAIASYRLAGRLAPRDPDLRANLQFVRNQIQGPTLVPDRWQRWLGTLTLNEWTLLAVTTFWVWLLLLALIQLRPAWKPPLRTTARLSGIATAVLSLCLGAAWQTHSTQSAVVVTPQAIVHNGPLDESQTAFVVHDGAELVILDRKEDWLQVGAGDRRSGWLKREQLHLLPARTAE
jgi:tetratricopeptide (TPR) repeat protein